MMVLGTDDRPTNRLIVHRLKRHMSLHKTNVGRGSRNRPETKVPKAGVGRSGWTGPKDPSAGVWVWFILYPSCPTRGGTSWDAMRHRTAKGSSGNPLTKSYLKTIVWVAIALVALWGVFSAPDHGPLFVVASLAIGLCIVGLVYWVFRGVVRLFHLHRG